MHDSFVKGEQQNDRQAQRVSDCFINSRDFVPPGRLFGDFWRCGELALFFGAAGTGKSVLAMQIADSIARGRGTEAFKMEAKRQKVLYVALALSDAEIQMRYTHPATQNSPSKHCEFSRNLYRERPGPKDKICEWLRGRVKEEGYKVIILDDINALRETYDGTRETLKLMRDLQGLKDELGISVLVLAGSREPGSKKAVSEENMQRSRVLCETADSVFAIGRHTQIPGSFCLIQTRSRNAPIVWNIHNAPVCTIERAEAGALILKFDKRFLPQMDEKLRQLICEIKSDHDAGDPYRVIAEVYGISKSQVGSLLKKWHPDLEPPDDDDDLCSDDDDDYEYDDKYEDEDEDEPKDEDEAANDGEYNAIIESISPHDLPISDPNSTSSEISAQPVYPGRADLLSHLKRSLDKNDREIFVEQEDENGKPLVWYMYDTTGQLSRCEFKGLGTTARHVDGPICLFNMS